MALRFKTQNAKRKTQDAFGRIGVLMGGPSSEREVSLKSGKAVYNSLKAQGVEAVPIDICCDDIRENIRLISSARIDCAFIALHGRFGEDGQVQGMLDKLGLPYTGSGESASRLAMDKLAARRIMEVHGLAVPRYLQLERASVNTCALRPELKFPLVVKPVSQGSSIGLSIVGKKRDLSGAIELAFGFDRQVMIEEYVRGREITVGILDELALPVIEISPKKKFFDYQAKYQPGMTDYKVPARLKRAVARRAKKAGLLAHRLLGCRGFSRVDMILAGGGTPFILEVNTIPGFTETSLLPKAAGVLGIDFAQLCLRLISLAYEKEKR